RAISEPPHQGPISRPCPPRVPLQIGTVANWSPNRRDGFPPPQDDPLSRDYDLTASAPGRISPLSPLFTDAELQNPNSRCRRMARLICLASTADSRRSLSDGGHS